MICWHGEHSLQALLSAVQCRWRKSLRAEEEIIGGGNRYSPQNFAWRKNTRIMGGLGQRTGSYIGLELAWYGWNGGREDWSMPMERIKAGDLG